MADTSRLNEALQALAGKVDELVSFKNSHPDHGGDDGQAIADSAADQVQAILARIP